MNIFIHGGPGFDDYLERAFDQTPIRGQFYTQNRPIADMAQAVQELSEKITTPSALIGHSWGGVVALEYLRKYGDGKVTALVLISTPISYHCETDFVEECKVRQITPGTGPEMIFLSREERSHNECLQELKNVFASFDPRSLENLQQYFNVFDCRETLSKLQIPVLIAFGSEDIRVPVRVQRDYRKLNPQADITEIPEAGHFPFLRKEDRQTLIRAIHAFLPR